MNISQLCYHSPWGIWHIEMTTTHITKLTKSEICHCKHNRLTSLTKECISQLDAYCNGTLTHFTLPLALKGTTFQTQVWDALKEIPNGKTLSYQQIAKYINKPNAARAVGSACKRNPLPIFIPCHRVTQSNGNIGNYSLGGANIKEKLLHHEKVIKNSNL